jgi:hypothetical protein
MSDLLWPDIADSFQALSGEDRANLIDSLLSEDHDRVRELPIEQFDMLCALALAAFHEISLRRQAQLDGRELIGPVADTEGTMETAAEVVHDEHRLPRDPTATDLWVLLLRWLTPENHR